MGNTVDVAHATWTNAIGAPELIGVWSDPDFDASMSPWVPKTTRERSYTSPIRYTPAK